MATVTGFTAARMLEIEETTIVDGAVDGDNLILTTRAGDDIDAGNVRGPAGPTGPAVADGNKGDITVSSGGTNWQINDSALATSTNLRVRRITSGQSIAGTTRAVIVFNTVDYDTASGYNTSNGGYTIPSTGLYIISTTVGIAINSNPNEISLEVWKNGDAAPRARLHEGIIRNGEAGDPWLLTGSDHMPWTAGDVLQIRVFNGGGNAVSVLYDYGQTHLAVAKLN